MGGIIIVAKDKTGNIKQDYNVTRKKGSGKIVEKNKLKDIQDEQRRIDGISAKSE